MTECYHICFTSHSEVMFRERSDYIFGIFSMVLAALQTRSLILAFALMSDHVHVVLNTSAYSNFVSIFRNSYTRHFNNKYRRVGRLGENGYYYLKLIGTHHIIAAISMAYNPPVRLDDIEPKYNISDLLKKEGGNFNEKKVTDLDVCNLIDKEYLKKYDVKSYVELSTEIKVRISYDLVNLKYAGIAQSRRCLAISE